ncbi:MAG TPA: hybrid sensor histidine kinase/response regulator [Desulfobulbaceae bacterium]|nr:hybrid sensor histidine kinase/response regulator [Desulfobulbaceae bacterium]
MSKNETAAFPSLRQQAEETLKAKANANQQVLSLEEANILLHELHVHQIELEMQKEELERAQIALIASRERYLDLYDLAPVGYLTLSEQGLILQANLTAATLLGLPRFALRKQPLSRFIAPVETNNYYLFYKKLLSNKELQTWEMQMLRADGANFVAQLQIILGQAEDGAAVYRCVLSDISARKIAEQETANLNAHLNQAQKMEAIGVLAGGIAHDFNNILAAIMGYTELVRKDAQPGSIAAQHLDQVLLASHRAAELVKQILAFSRQSTADKTPMDIGPLVKESLKLLRSSIPSTISICQDIQPHCGITLADPTQIHQIVMNLCTNAAYAMGATGGELLVRMKPVTLGPPTAADTRQLAPGQYIELTVSDTGTGIGPDIIDKIFDPYFTTKEAGKGTGMGLSITHVIVTGYGGKITVESTLGQGTTFHVYLPVIQEEAKEAAELNEAPRGTGRILFIDDEEMLRELGQALLEDLGYTVTARSNSLEALTTFMNEPDQFDLVITDQTMPGITGVDLARRMLQIRPDIPIILCTGYSNLVDEESAKAIGIRDFALKPLSKSAIGHLVNKILKEG